MQSLKLIQAKEQDITLIAELAKLVWNQHYPSIISQAQIDYMLNWMYSTESLKEQMQIKKHQFFLIENGNEKIGFISVNNEKEKDWFLNKFYIDQTKSAKGIGSIAFDLLLENIHPKKITLTVNRQNFKSINFYFKKGFVIERVADFDIGNGYVMDDFVMVWKRRNDN
jgi:RimJ/RimL family protein N-acetyltransferase